MAELTVINMLPKRRKLFTATVSPCFVVWLLKIILQYNVESRSTFTAICTADQRRRNGYQHYFYFKADRGQFLLSAEMERI